MIAEDATLIDLSIGLEPDIESEPWPAEIESMDHVEGAEALADRLSEIAGIDIDAADFPDGLGLAWETVHAITHAGTHLDAPWHYGPTVAGEDSRTIDEIPLEWCWGRAVVLDFRDAAPGTEITPDGLDARLADLDYTLRPGDIVFIETGSDDLWGTPEYLTEFPGMSAAATEHLVEQGIRVIGTDAYGFDKPFATMGERYAQTGDNGELWPAHFVGRELEYCQIEKLANLDALPRRTGIPVVAFPIAVAGASAGWVRPVAFV